jgi:hypothetical protein
MEIALPVISAWLSATMSENDLPSAGKKAEYELHDAFRWNGHPGVQKIIVFPFLELPPYGS